MLIPIGLTTIILILFVIIIKIFFLYKVNQYLSDKKYLEIRFLLPNIFRLTFGNLLIVTSVTFSLLALYQTKANEAELSQQKKSVDILFLIDVSLSMNAVDIYPSRLKRAQDLLQRIAPDLSGNRVGIIAFAGNAFSFCPMTSDMTAFSDYVNALGVDMIGKKGTDLSKALSKAETLLSSTKLLKNRIIVIISDGEEHESSLPKKLDAETIVWGIGTEEGGKIYFGEENAANSGYVTNAGGLSQDSESPDIIITKLNENFLKELSGIGNGKYYNVSQESFGVYKLLDQIDQMQKNQTLLLQKIKKEDGAEIYLIIAVACFLLERLMRFFYFPKNKIINVSLILFLVLAYTPISAWELDPGGNLIEEGNKLYEEKKFNEANSKYKEADEYFSDDIRLQFNKGDTDYQLGKFEEAIKKNQSIIDNPNVSKDLKAKSYYNLGNAYFKQKDMKAAQKNYEEALKLNPEHLPSKKNLELLFRKNPNQNSTSNNKQSNHQKNQESNSDHQSKENKNAKQNKDQSERESADRMMDHFSPDSILKPKNRSGGNGENEKFW
ncbi:MAG: VWA domain-containing protein [Leptospira sp.]|nr:VWA domain-containing protein [Leptospira sp.]